MNPQTSKKVLIVLFIGITTFLAAQDHSNHIREAIFFDFDDNALNRILTDQAQMISFEVPGMKEAVTLELYKCEILSDDFRLQTIGENQRGSWKYDPHSDKFNECFYRGVVKGSDASLAIATFMKDYISIYFQIEDKSYRIHTYDDKSYVLYAEDDLLHSGEVNCLSDLLYPGNHEEGFHIEMHGLQMNIHSQGGDAKANACVEISIECDYQTYLDHGEDVVAVEQYVLSIMNEVITLYTNEDIPLLVSELFIWTTPDPYINLIDPIAILFAFKDRKNTNGYNGRLAHLFSTRNLGGSVAFRDVLCNDTIPYGITTSHGAVKPFPEYSKSVYLMAHEIGHNFGPPHTHNCVWNGNNSQIDDCGNLGGSSSCYDPDNPIIPYDGGTIMSYCNLNAVGVNFQKGFAQQCGDMMRDRFYNASCYTGCSGNPPQPPSDIHCEVVYGRWMQIQWEEVEDVHGYKLFRSQIGTDNYSCIATISVPETTFIDKWIEPNEVYCYKLIAYSSEGESDYSNESCDSIPAFTNTQIIASSLESCEQTFLYPLVFENAVDINYFRLVLEFPDDSMSFADSIILHPSLNEGNFAMIEENGKILFNWMSADPILIAKDTMMQLMFEVENIVQPHQIRWDTSGTNCILKDISGNEVTADYTDGSIWIIPALEAPIKPEGKDTVCVNYQSESTYISTSSSQEVEYLWELTPAEAGTLNPLQNEVDIGWNTSLEFPLTAALKLNVFNECDTLTSETLEILLSNDENCGLGKDDPEQRPLVRIWPNPSTGIVYIAPYQHSAIATYTIDVYSAEGLSLFSGISIDVIDLSVYPDGLYFVRVTSGESNEYHKVVKTE